MDKILDFDLFSIEPFKFVYTKEDKTKIKFNIKFISAVMEFELIKLQPEISSKTKDIKNLDQEYFEKWKMILKKVLRENKDDNNNPYDDTIVDFLGFMEVIYILMGIIRYVNSRIEKTNEIFCNIFDDKTKAEIKQNEEDLKKKITEQAG